MRRNLFCLLLALVFATAVRAGEPTKEEEKFLKGLLGSLEADSADVRDAAEEALVRMGDTAAAYLVTNMKRVDRDLLPVVTRVLIRIGYPALTRLKSLHKFPSGAPGDALREVAKALSAPGGSNGFGDPDPEIAAKVVAIMEEVPPNSFSPRHPAIAKLVALGRPAVPALVPYLKPSSGKWAGFRDHVAATALGKLCDRDDTPKLCLLLDRGWVKAAAILLEVGDPSCVPALVRALKANRMSKDVGAAIAKFSHPSTRTPIVQYLEKHGDAYAPGTSALLDTLVSLRATEAIPILKRMAKAAGNERIRNSRVVGCSRALVLLGDAAGFAGLFTALSLTGMDSWLGFQAGQTLNAVTGQTFFDEKGSPGKARKEYAAWYARVRSRLEWNEELRRFEVR